MTSSIYEDQLNKDIELIQRTSNFKQYCAVVGWMKYENLKDGWVKGLYDTIKEHPHRYWCKSLHFPKIKNYDDLFLDTVLATKKPNKDYYSLSTSRTEFECGGYSGPNARVIKQARNGRPMLSKGEYYHIYVKPKKKVAEFFEANLIEGLSSFEMIRQGNDNETYLIVARSRSSIGAWWCSLLVGADNANPQKRLKGDSLEIQNKRDQLTQEYKEMESA